MLEQKSDNSKLFNCILLVWTSLLHYMIEIGGPTEIVAMRAIIQAKFVMNAWQRADIDWQPRQLKPILMYWQTVCQRRKKIRLEVVASWKQYTARHKLQRAILSHWQKVCDKKNKIRVGVVQKWKCYTANQKICREVCRDVCRIFFLPIKARQIICAWRQRWTQRQTLAQKVVCQWKEVCATWQGNRLRNVVTRWKALCFARKIARRRACLLWKDVEGSGSFRVQLLAYYRRVAKHCLDRPYLLQKYGGRWLIRWYRRTEMRRSFVARRETRLIWMVFTRWQGLIRTARLAQIGYEKWLIRYCTNILYAFFEKLAILEYDYDRCTGCLRSGTICHGCEDRHKRTKQQFRDLLGLASSASDDDATLSNVLKACQKLSQEEASFLATLLQKPLYVSFQSVLAVCQILHDSAGRQLALFRRMRELFPSVSLSQLFELTWKRPVLSRTLVVWMRIYHVSTFFAQRACLEMQAPTCIWFDFRWQMLTKTLKKKYQGKTLLTYLQQPNLT